MFKKPLASLIAAAVLAAGSGDLAAASAAQATTRGPVAGVSVIPAIGTGLNNHAPSASFSNAPTPTLTILTAPAPQSAPGIAAPAMEESSPLAVIQSRDARVGVAEKGEALNALFDDTLATGHQAIETLGPSALSDGKAMKPGLSRPGAAARAAGVQPAAAPAPVKTTQAGVISDFKVALVGVALALGAGWIMAASPTPAAGALLILNVFRDIGVLTLILTGGAVLAAAALVVAAAAAWFLSAPNTSSGSPTHEPRIPGPVPVRMRGVVLRFIDLKGFGFIRPGDGSEDLYVHFSEIERSGFQTLHEGEEVEFEIRRTPHGPVAARVIVLQNRG